MFGKENKFGVPPFEFDLSEVTPLVYAFAHNDAVYNSPLFDALALGYQFIEVDIHLVKNEILVYHKKPFFINKNKTLTNCYLNPLFKILKKGGSVYPKSGKTIYLILDIKSNAEKTYEKLKSTLLPFHSMLTHWEDEIEKSNSISIILSGNRPIQKVKSESKRWVAIDGRLKDIDKNYSSQLMPIISDKYSKIFGFSFYPKNPNTKHLNQLQHFANQIHQQKKLFRLWGIPERESVWKLLLANDLDLISTDRIKKLETFIQNHSIA